MNLYVYIYIYTYRSYRCIYSICVLITCGYVYLYTSIIHMYIHNHNI